MSKINRKQRKQLARDISKYNQCKKVSNFRRLVGRALVEDRKGFYCSLDLLKVLSPSSFTILLRLANGNKHRRNSIFFEPVVI